MAKEGKDKGIKIYDLKQAERVAGKWDKNHSSIQMEGRKLKDELVEKHNKNFEQSGSYFELNEEKTKEFLSKINSK